MTAIAVIACAATVALITVDVYRLISYRLETLRLAQSYRATYELQALRLRHHLESEAGRVQPTGQLATIHELVNSKKPPADSAAEGQSTPTT